MNCPDCGAELKAYGRGATARKHGRRWTCPTAELSGGDTPSHRWLWRESDFDNLSTAERVRLMHVRLVETPQGVILYRHGRRYDHSNGQPFYFNTRAGALATDASETEMELSRSAGEDDGLPF